MCPELVVQGLQLVLVKTFAVEVGDQYRHGRTPCQRGHARTGKRRSVFVLARTGNRSR